jgi:hypothetical protein
MEDSSYEHNYFLDLETGEILFVSDYMDSEETEKLTDKIDGEPERFERIPKAESYEGYEDMEDFIAAVEDKHLAELLEVAIDGKGAFHRFKGVLARHPEGRERWFRFKDERMEQRALEWLDDIGVNPVGE